MAKNLYEKLYAENLEFKKNEIKHDNYIRDWKKRFGYRDNVSFDVLLNDTLELKKYKEMWENLKESVGECMLYNEDCDDNYDSGCFDTAELILNDMKEIEKELEVK